MCVCVCVWRFHYNFGCSPSPPQSLLTVDERFNLALIGSLPHQSISQVRIHWLLDLITLRYSCWLMWYLTSMVAWAQLYFSFSAKYFLKFKNVVKESKWLNQLFELISAWDTRKLLWNFVYTITILYTQLQFMIIIFLVTELYILLTSAGTH